MKEIKEPIFNIEDKKHIYKYNNIEYASSYCEFIEGINENEEWFDSNFRKLILYKKDKYNRVGFKLSEDEKTYKDVVDKYIRNYYKEYTDVKDFDSENLEVLIENFKSIEWGCENGNSLFYDFYLWIKSKITKFKS